MWILQNVWEHLLYREPVNGCFCSKRQVDNTKATPTLYAAYTQTETPITGFSVPRFFSTVYKVQADSVKWIYLLLIFALF